MLKSPDNMVSQYDLKWQKQCPLLYPQTDPVVVTSPEDPCEMCWGVIKFQVFIPMFI